MTKKQARQWQKSHARAWPGHLKHMDDKEYYTLMNRPSSWGLQQILRKNSKSAKKTPPTHNAVDGVNSFTSLEARQGRADAEMLMEKQDSKD